MPVPFHLYAEKVARLHGALGRLQSAAAQACVPPLAGREWYELLQRKLRPQLSDEAYLVVAVAGGTNIGKSVIFNHIAGARASATSPLASGTKHPVCLVPPGFPNRHRLDDIFPGFQLAEWTDPSQALNDAPEHQLFWRECEATPDNLLVLDTPDIDSDAQVNWERAGNIRRCADLLIAVLTQQKYNDAAVKQFFRQAAAEDKAVIVVFNQCLLPEDEEYWPRWLETFCGETGVQPEWIYIAPNDRRAAEELRLPYYERTRAAATPSVGASSADRATASNTPHDLLADLSRLRFGEVKVRALRGALLRLVDKRDGVPAYLREIEAAATEFGKAAELLSAHQLAEVDHWPVVPSPLLIAEIRRWWQDQRTGWPAKVHGFYNALGQGLSWPLRAARDKLRGEVVAPWEAYRVQEWTAILTAVEKVYDKLTFLSQLGNEALRPRLEAVLSGTSRAELVRAIHAAHDRMDLEHVLAQLVREGLAGFRQESPRHYEFFRRLDLLAAAARPMTSVALFVTGFGPVGHAITPVLTDTALQGVVHVAGDVAGGTIAAAVGDAVISEGAATGAGYLEAKFRKLHLAFTSRRAAWLAGLLQTHLLGPLPEEIRNAAELPRSEAYRDVCSSLDQLQNLLAADAPGGAV